MKLYLDDGEEVKLEALPVRVELLVCDDDGDLGELLRHVVPHDVALLLLVRLQQPQPVHCLRLASSYQTEIEQNKEVD